MEVYARKHSVTVSQRKTSPLLGAPEKSPFPGGCCKRPLTGGFLDAENKSAACHSCPMHPRLHGHSCYPLPCFSLLQLESCLGHKVLCGRVTHIAARAQNLVLVVICSAFLCCCSRRTIFTTAHLPTDPFIHQANTRSGTRNRECHNTATRCLIEMVPGMYRCSYS